MAEKRYTIWRRVYGDGNCGPWNIGEPGQPVMPYADTERVELAPLAELEAVGEERSLVRAELQAKTVLSKTQRLAYDHLKAGIEAEVERSEMAVFEAAMAYLRSTEYEDLDESYWLGVLIGCEAARDRLEALLQPEEG